MADTCTAAEAPPVPRLNVADRLREVAAKMPAAIAIACPLRRRSRNATRRPGKSGTMYATTTFAELNDDATRIARGLAEWGVPAGTRLALLVTTGIEFVTLVFALLRAGMVTILVDPGLGRRNMVRCLADAEPEGFIAISLAQAARVWLRSRFPRARWNVTVGRRWFWSGRTLDQLRTLDTQSAVGGAPPTKRSTTALAGSADPTPDDPAAIIFTSGSTGPPKGVLYTHRMFDTQVTEIQSRYGIEPGGIDLSCFPLFALFNSAMGIMTVLPDMDFSRPAKANPKKLLAAAKDWHVSQAFASPAVWRVVSDYCAETGERIESLHKVFSCGAPVPADVLRKTLACVAKGAKMHTPYGATECLPVSTIDASEVLGETAQKTDHGAGVCVGRKFDSIDWRVIRITDEPIAMIERAEELPIGDIGELIVRGPQASPTYVTRTEANATSKIADCCTHWAPGTADSKDQREIRNPKSEIGPWHRMGDVGYLDDEGRFWYCGRKSHRVKTAAGPIFSEQVEAIINTHPAVRRSALVGVGTGEAQTPVVIVEPSTEFVEHHALDFEIVPYIELANQLLALASANPVSAPVKQVLFYPLLPVDVRHNAKINREQLAAWATNRLADRKLQSPAPSP
jgi:acyl-CoA synthetase (AMP-forming)/AMP-acid ligase II